jgi:hypothetical protein
MSLSVAVASTQRAVNASSPITTYPFSLGLWHYPFDVSTTRGIWSLCNSGANDLNQFYLWNNTGTWTFSARDGVSISSNTVAGATANAWAYLFVRAISATNRWLSVLKPDGSIAHSNNVTSRDPSGCNQMSLGSREDATPDIFGNGRSAEFFITDTDIQPDAAQTSEPFIRQLAYRGPFSVPSIKKDIVEYRSFRSFAPTSDKWNEVYYGKKGRQTWTNTNAATIGPHPPAAEGYVQPHAIDNNIFIYAPPDLGGVTVTGNWKAHSGFLVNTGALMNT